MSDLNSPIFLVALYCCPNFASDLKPNYFNSRMKNFTKKLLVVLLALLPCFQTPALAGGDGDPDPELIPVKPHPGTGTGTTPRARSRARFVINDGPACYYYEGEVTIEAGSSITSIDAQVTRLEDNVTWSDTDMGDTLIMDVSTDPGTYILTFTLSNGQSYIGEYHLY